MAYKSGKDVAAIYFDGVDVKQSNNQLSINDEAVLPARRPLGSAYKTLYPTAQYDGEITISGWLDSVTQAQLADHTADDKVVSVLHEGSTVSDRFFGIQSAKIGGRKLGMAEDDLDTYEPVIVISGPLNYGYVAYAGTLGAAGNTDSAYATMVETSAASGTAFLHISAIDLGGYTSITIKVRHSDDHITFTDLATFTTATAIGAEVKAIAATVNKYLSISHAYVGAGAAPAVTAFVGVAVD